MSSKFFNNILMTLHLVTLILLSATVNSLFLLRALGIIYLLITLFSICYVIKLAMEDRFYFQIIPVIILQVYLYSLGFNYTYVGDLFKYIYLLIIIVSFLLALFVGIKMRCNSTKKYATTSIIVLVIVLLICLPLASIINIVFADENIIVSEYELVEKTDEYNAAYLTDISTVTYRVKSLSESDAFDFNEVELKQKLDVKIGDIVVVEIRKGLFEPVYKILKKGFEG